MLTLTDIQEEILETLGFWEASLTLQELEQILGEDIDPDELLDLVEHRLVTQVKDFINPNNLRAGLTYYYSITLKGLRQLR